MKRAAVDWPAQDRLEARIAEAALLRSVPAQWAEPIKGMRAHGRNEEVWAHASAWRGRLKEFADKHGDALRWSLSDGEICTRAKEIAADVADLLNPAYGPFSEADSLDVVLLVCRSVDVAKPVGITAAGVIARGLSPDWWRRVLRKKVARVVEAGAIRLGLVNRITGGYASDGAVTRRGEQLARNAAMLEKSIMRNEAGQVFTLAELAKTSVANPEIRGGELMTRIRGCEEFAEAAGHVALFVTMTTPSAFHAVTVGKGKGKPRKNPAYDGESNPRDAQAWLCKMWARSRAALARKGIDFYGFRVAEPHHDGTPHWHALLWFKTDADAARFQEVIAARWLSEFGGERGAVTYRTNFKRMDKGGAAGYIAKYIAKNIGHFDVGDSLDDADNLQFVVWSGDVQGWQRVNAWAATWGIRQFQAIGQPSVTVWRELRRVTPDQVDAARMQGEKVADQAYSAVHKAFGVAACWRRYMLAMGGVCLARLAYRIQPAKRINEVVNAYGETIEQKKIVGVELESGRWLVSRRQAWARAVGAAVQSPHERAACGAPWTGFNNCTARLTGKLRAALLGLNSAGVHGYT